MASGSRFRVHSPFLGIKSLTRRTTYVTVPAGTIGEVIEVYGEPGRPGLVLIRVNREMLFTLERDLENRTFEVPPPIIAGDPNSINEPHSVLLDTF